MSAPAVWSTCIAGTFFLLWLIKGWIWRDYITMGLSFLVLFSCAISDKLLQFQRWLLYLIKLIDPDDYPED